MNKRKKVNFETFPGHCKKIGTVFENGGINFAIYCKMATQMDLLLFEDENDTNPIVINLPASTNKTGYYFHVFVKGLTEGQLYGWRVSKVNRLRPTNYWDPAKVLIDPYSFRVVFPKNYNRMLNTVNSNNINCCPKTVAINIFNDYDWECDTHPNVPISQTVIYELHVKGFTAHESSQVTKNKRGTYAGLIEKIPYLKELGITAVELLPVFQFDQTVGYTDKPNYWGYDPITFFAPNEQYSSDKSIKGPINEFRDMVKALHKEGIEVYLDVVYNHTSEGDNNGPVFNLKGLANDEYYLINQDGTYLNFTGCGNTVNASSPVTKNMIMNSLHFWADIMHVDGFRFDLASILSRDSNGEPRKDPPTLLAIDTDYKLANIKIIAEAWDAAGLYQVGSLPGSRWREWNGDFRDVVRKFIKGDDNLVLKLVQRFKGSPDIYASRNLDPYKSLNFVTCHDGFTLWDLLSYNQKHNEANGENNRDGNDYNFSWNHGVEGETTDNEINQLRLRQAKNLIFLTIMSIGTPMFTMGDEILRTQKGNNNPYCQDNEISYMNWNYNNLQKDMLNFYRKIGKLKHFRIYHNAGATNFTLEDQIRASELCLHGTKPYLPDMSYTSHTIGLTYYCVTYNMYVYIFINSYWNDVSIEIPKVPNTNQSVWYRIMDTSMPTPYDLTLSLKDQIEINNHYYLKSRSVLMLFSRKISTE